MAASLTVKSAYSDSTAAKGVKASLVRRLLVQQSLEAPKVSVSDL